MRRIVAISDFCDRVPPEPVHAPPESFARAWGCAEPVPHAGAARVTGGYLERLPLAAVAAGLADVAEVWTWAGQDGEDAFDARRALHGGVPRGPWIERPGLLRRVLRAEGHPAPYGSRDAVAHMAAQGAPDILCVWGLGVAHEVLDAARGAVLVYNSIDVPPLRVPLDLARRFDVILAGSDWQAEAIRAACPEALVAVLPIGPEFASPDTFRPLGLPKDFDVAYVAAAQPYKRHDLLLDTLERRPGTRALCVMGYGEMGQSLRGEAARRGLDVTFVGPPGVSHDEVNRLINRARVGLVCGRDDGAPAILTEYMLAGLPVLANAELACGLQYVTPETGLAAREGEFAEALGELLGGAGELTPRRVVEARWTWPHGIARFQQLVDEARLRKRRHEG